MYKEGFALNNQQFLHAIKDNRTKAYVFNIYVSRGFLSVSHAMKDNQTK